MSEKSGLNQESRILNCIDPLESVILHYLLSKVLQLECGLDGLCGGRLRGPSMLRDIKLLCIDNWLSLALIAEVVSFAEDIPLLIVQRELGCIEPGVLDVDL